MKKIYRMITFLLVLGIVFQGQTVYAARKKKKKDKVRWVKSKTGIKSLLQLAKDRGLMIRRYNNDTKSYEKLRKDVDSGELNQGITAAEILKKYGEPVISFEAEGGTLSKWVYKPSNKTFFDREKIYLKFNGKEELIEIKQLQDPT